MFQKTSPSSIQDTCASIHATCARAYLKRAIEKTLGYTIYDLRNIGGRWYAKVKGGSWYSTSSLLSRDSNI